MAWVVAAEVRPQPKARAKALAKSRARAQRTLQLARQWVQSVAKDADLKQIRERVQVLSQELEAAVDGASDPEDLVSLQEQLEGKLKVVGLKV